jgi:uncharacterized protein YebE (UPF0316 family)
MKYLILFLVGIIEAFGTTLNSKFRQRSHKSLSFISAIVNVFVWAYIINQVVENINNFWLIFSYAVAYASGDVLGLYFDGYLEKIAKFKGIKLLKKRKNIKRKK